MQIHGYHLEGEMTNRNAGFSRWTPCTKDGHRFFIKEFLAPVYPVETHGLSARLITRKRKVCNEFYERKRAFYQAMERCRTGNNVIARDFFRDGSRYYLVTDWIDTAPIEVGNVCRLSERKRATLIRALVYSVASIHAAHIIHADLKPDNLLLKATKKGCLAAKVIDFDAGFLEGNIPKDVQGDFVYLAPETFLRMDNPEVPIGTEVDIFALGLILHQYWTGSLPTIDPKYHYAFEAVLGGDEPKLSEDLPDCLRSVISQSLKKDPADRPRAVDMLGELASLGPVHVGPAAMSEHDVERRTVEVHAVEPTGFFVPTNLG